MKKEYETNQIGINFDCRHIETTRFQEYTNTATGNSWRNNGLGRLINKGQIA